MSIWKFFSNPSSDCHDKVHEGHGQLGWDFSVWLNPAIPAPTAAGQSLGLLCPLKPNFQSLNFQRQSFEEIEWWWRWGQSRLKPQEL